MTDKSKQRIRFYKINEIAGKLRDTYKRLENEIIEIDKCAFVLWEPFAKVLDIKVEDYIKIPQLGEDVIFQAYKEYRFKKYLQDLEEGKDVKRYASEKTARRENINKAKKEFDEILSPRRRSFRYYQTPWNHPVTNFFIDCLFLDPEDGLLIDGNLFIKKYNDITEAEQSEKHAQHIKAVNALNEFFKGNVINWKLIERYFSIEKGKIVANQKNVTVRGYKDIL